MDIFYSESQKSRVYVSNNKFIIIVTNCKRQIPGIYFSLRRCSKWWNVFLLIQIITEALSIAASQNLISIYKVTIHENGDIPFSGWNAPLPTIDELSRSPIFTSLCTHSIFLAMMWFGTGFFSGLYSFRLPYNRPQQIFDITNQQFLSVCNVSVLLLLLYIFVTKMPVTNGDLSMYFLELALSYVCIFVYRCQYSSTFRNYFDL